MNDSPEPGSPEYEAMMADRFRPQGDTSLPLSEETEYRQVGGLGINIRASSTLGPNNREESFSEEAAAPSQIEQMEQEISRIRAELRATNGFNRRTGEPKLRLIGQERRSRELRIAQLERELPYVREMVGRAQEWRAANMPTPEEKLAAEAEHQTAIRQRAREIADEREAQVQADRVLAARRARRGSN